MTKYEKAKELTARSGLKEDLMKSMKGISKQLLKLIGKEDQEFEKLANPLIEEYMIKVGERFEELEEMMVRLNEKSYTEGELDALLALYRTPEGASIMKKSPSILIEAHEKASEWGTAIMSKILENVISKKMKILEMVSKDDPRIS